jgi:IS30 family transposase
VLRLPDSTHNSLHTTLVSIGLPHYEPLTAQALYQARAKNSHQKHKLTGQVLQLVINMLKNGLSPELISGRLHLEQSYKLHHETIYRMVYSKDFQHLNLWEYLSKAHKKRKNKHKRQGARSNIPYRVSIHNRLEAVNNRSEFGHWEADSVLSSRVGEGGIQTQVERMSRYICARKVKAITSAEGIKAALDIFNSLPPLARKSTTFDNGSEFTKHYELNKQLQMNTYFADPYSAYQRGTNEHANGKLRKFFPKGTNFSTVTNSELQEVVDFFNTRAMKCLGYKTPEEVFEDELSKLV